LVLGTFPLLSGSGKPDTPWERMQREKASAPVACADPAELVEEEEAVPPHPQMSRARPAVTMTTARWRPGDIYLAFGASARLVFASATETAWSCAGVNPAAASVSVSTRPV